jgi:hypothetical protein
MNDSILQGAQAIDFGYVQGAWRRIEAMRSTEADAVDPPTVAELEEALGEAVQKCDLFAKNWRNRVYRIELGHGRFVLGKQLVMGTDAMLQYQYDELRALAALQVPGLRVPNTFALLPAKRLLLIEFVPGKTIENLAWNSEDVVPACELAGKILARLQLARTESIRPMPVDVIDRDLALAPWRLSRWEKATLQSTLEKLAAAEVRIGHVYYDYKPANLIYQTNALFFLIDPPDVWWRGAHLWDYACFRSSMRRHLWRISLRRPYDRQRRTTIRQGLAAFEQGYLTSFDNRHPVPPLFTLAVQLFELQRNAVFMTMKKGKVNMARQLIRIRLPLLEMEKRWLFQRLAREMTQ